MTDDLHIDYETRSAVDLKKTGAYVYAEDETTDIWCACYAVGDEDVKLWHPDLDDRDIRHAIKNVPILYAHNAAFERAISKYLMTWRYGWPDIDVERWRCTMAQALAMSLPASLENAAAALGLTVRKDMEGHTLMMRMARPRRRNPDGSFIWWDVPERKERLYAYCKTDVEVERELGKRLLPLRESEQRLWWLDQKINDRGVCVDTHFCEAAKRVVEQAVAELNTEMKQVTGRKVSGVTDVQGLTKFINDNGVNANSIAKEKLAELLQQADLPSAVERALEIRQEGGKTSVAKIDALIRGKARNGRAQGLMQYHAASTGRWSGRRFQPQNLKRPNEETDVEGAIETIRKGCSARTVEWLYGPPLDIVGDCTRGMVIAEPGNKLYVGDFTSIEGVVLPWLAGEQWVLDAFREYIAGRAPDLYIQGYCKTFSVPLFSKKDPRRQFGKVMELASGYQGGHGAYLKMGAKGKKLEALTDTVERMASAALWSEASEKFVASRAHGLGKRQWTALRIVIDAWRTARPNIRQFWYDLEDAAIAAVRNPGRTFDVGGGDRPSLLFKKAGSFLWLRLPSGRALCYPYPRVDLKTTPWGEQKSQVVYKGVDAYTRKWGDCWVYGGLLAENVTQAVSRDLLAESMTRHEAAGYPIVLHVHDEEVAETPADFGSLKEFLEIMEILPPWAEGCPVAAAGWEGTRYKKE